MALNTNITVICKGSCDWRLE